MAKNIVYHHGGYVINTYVPSGGASPQNLLLYSEEMDNLAAWSAGGFIVTPNTDNDISGSLTLETINDQGEYGSIQQTLAVTENTQYTFSFEAKRGTATVCRYSVRDASNLTDLIPRNQGDFFGLINSSTPTRVSFTFTTPAGCTLINLYVARPNETSTGTTKIGRAQLNTGASVKPYVTTTSTPVP